MSIIVWGFVLMNDLLMAGGGGEENWFILTILIFFLIFSICREKLTRCRVETDFGEGRGNTLTCFLCSRGHQKYLQFRRRRYIIWPLVFLKASTSVWVQHIVYIVLQSYFLMPFYPGTRQKKLIVVCKGVIVAETLLCALNFLTSVLWGSELQIKSNVVLHPSFRSLFFLRSRSLFDFKVWAHRHAFSQCPAYKVVLEYDLMFFMLIHREQSSYIHT